MAKLGELGEFVRSASSTIEPPVVRKLRDVYPAQPAQAVDTPPAPARKPAARAPEAAPAAGPAAGPLPGGPRPGAPRPGGPRPGNNPFAPSQGMPRSGAPRPGAPRRER